MKFKGHLTEPCRCCFLQGGSGHQTSSLGMREVGASLSQAGGIGSRQPGMGLPGKRAVAGGLGLSEGRLVDGPDGQTLRVAGVRR